MQATLNFRHKKADITRQDELSANLPIKGK